MELLFQISHAFQSLANTRLPAVMYCVREKGFVLLEVNTQYNVQVTASALNIIPGCFHGIYVLLKIT